ncbi:hypothetical protein BCR34DRAFT_180587 [Clohesyomyces aquaticus]|uniref:Uncharacterized protein n=1 Tax=Clohesyomyces aquaticus TaxID=1231657 RepID=A0A1Y1YEN7_9PLEO|nr:hypothetical protein BCR34DRAFT_180587 [Clohesyomyces aquaticus]
MACVERIKVISCLDGHLDPRVLEGRCQPIDSSVLILSKTGRAWPRMRTSTFQNNTGGSPLHDLTPPSAFCPRLCLLCHFLLASAKRRLENAHEPDCICLTGTRVCNRHLLGGVASRPLRVGWSQPRQTCLPSPSRAFQSSHTR